MKNKTILLTLMALTIISVTVMTVSCRKELKITPDNTVQFTGDRTVYENEVITKLCLDTVVRTDFYGLTNEQAAEAAALAIKGFYDHYSISLPTTLSSIEDQFEYYITNLVLADPNTVWTGTISLIYDSLTAGELGIIEEAREILEQDFSGMTSSEICGKISDDAEDLLEEHSLNGEDSLLASTLMPVIMGASEYCLALSDGVPADSMAKIIQAGATGYIVGHASALFLHLEGIAIVDNGLFMASLAGGLKLNIKENSEIRMFIDSIGNFHNAGVNAVVGNLNAEGLSHSEIADGAMSIITSLYTSKGIEVDNSSATDIANSFADLLTYTTLDADSIWREIAIGLSLTNISSYQLSLIDSVRQIFNQNFGELSQYQILEEISSQSEQMYNRHKNEYQFKINDRLGGFILLIANSSATNIVSHFNEESEAFWNPVTAQIDAAGYLYGWTRAWVGGDTSQSSRIKAGLNTAAEWSAGYWIVKKVE